MSQTLNILLAGQQQAERELLTMALSAMRPRAHLQWVSDHLQLMDFLQMPKNTIPDVLFMDIKLPPGGALDSLTALRAGNILRSTVVAMFSDPVPESIMEEAFVGGANIFITRHRDAELMKHFVRHAVNMFWQYHSWGMPLENFLLNINASWPGLSTNGKSNNGKKHDQ